MRPVHVLQLLQGLNIGGIERMALSLVSQLDRAAFRSSFCTFDWKGQLVPELERLGFTLHHRKRQGGVDVGFVLWLARLLRSQQVDIVQAHNATALLYGAAATMLVPRTRLLYTEHDRTFPSPWRERSLHALLARRADAVATVSQTLGCNLAKYECFPSNRIHVIRNGVALDPPTRSRPAMRSELGIDARPTAGIVARLAPVKNHELLLQAWKQVVEQIPEALLIVVGNGTQEPALRQLHERLGLERHVRFLGFRTDINNILSALDVFVLSSRSEGLSLTLIEAAAMGLPVVATNVGGNPEVVRDGETGLLVPSEDATRLAAALASFLQDPELRARCGLRAHEFYGRSFTLDAMVRGYTQLYLALAGQPPSSPAVGASTRSERTEPERPEAIEVGVR